MSLRHKPLIEIKIKSEFGSKTSPSVQHYEIHSRFLRHCLLYDVVQLTDFEKELLEKTDYNTSYICRLLFNSVGIRGLRREVKDIYMDLHYKDPTVPEKNFKFEARTIKRFKTIGRYAREHSSDFFSGMDAGGKTRKTGKKVPKKK